MAFTTALYSDKGEFHSDLNAARNVNMSECALNQSSLQMTLIGSQVRALVRPPSLRIDRAAFFSFCTSKKVPRNSGMAPIWHLLRRPCQLPKFSTNFLARIAVSRCSIMSQYALLVARGLVNVSRETFDAVLVRRSGSSGDAPFRSWLHTICYWLAGQG